MKRKNKPIQLHIPEPCTQEFSKMHPLPGGRFCDHCEKTVIDFRGMSDGQIAHIYQKRKGRVCGIFHNDQLNRELIRPELSHKKSSWKMVATMAASLFFGNISTGQTPEKPEKIYVEKKASEPFLENNKKTISGNVIDENGEPLMFASIVLKGTQHGTYTDENGNFNLSFPENINATEIECSYVGFESKSIFLENEHFNKNRIDIKLKPGLKLPEATVIAQSRMFSQGGPRGIAVLVHKDGQNDNEIKREEIIWPETTPDVSVFPNPFVSHIFIKINPEKSEAFLFHLYSESGQLLFAETKELEKGEQEVYLDINNRNLTEGVYFLRISDGVGEIKTKRIIKVSP